MKQLFKLAHFVIVGLFVITGNDIYDKILGSCIAIVSFVYAFRFTGSMANDLSYNSLMMSFVHWTIRTLITIVSIILTRIPYEIFLDIFRRQGHDDYQLLSVGLCIIGWIILAEATKSITGINKNYF
jgi:hypothetical protein